MKHKYQFEVATTIVHNSKYTVSNCPSQNIVSDLVNTRLRPFLLKSVEYVCDMISACHFQKRLVPCVSCSFSNRQKFSKRRRMSDKVHVRTVDMVLVSVQGQAWFFFILFAESTT